MSLVGVMYSFGFALACAYTHYVMPQARSPSNSDEAPRWVATIIEGLWGLGVLKASEYIAMILPHGSYVVVR